MKRAALWIVNCVLILVIVLLIGATWLPAIYTSDSFQNSPWVRKHLIDKPLTDPPQKTVKP